MSSFIEKDPNNILEQPDLKTLLSERQELNDKRNSSKNLIEKIRLSSQIASLDKRIVNASNLKVK